MIRAIIMSVMVLFAALCFMLPAQADVTRQEKLKHADKNRDSVVDNKEMRMEKNWERSHDAQVNTTAEKKADTNGDGVLSSAEKVKVRSKANTEAEKKYDENDDGWLDATEGKAYLEDKYIIIKTEGKAKVDSSLEEPYDTNKDGVIDANEAQALKKHLEGS